MIPYKQLSLADIFQDCQNKFNNDKPAFLSLLETHNVIYCVRHHCFLKCILGIGRTSAYLLVKEEHFSSIPLPAGSHEYCGV